MVSARVMRGAAPPDRASAAQPNLARSDHGAAGVVAGRKSSASIR